MTETPARLAVLLRALLCIHLGAVGAAACSRESEADIQRATREAMEAGQYHRFFTEVRSAVADCPCSARTAAIQDRIATGLRRHHADLERLGSHQDEVMSRGRPFGPSTLVGGWADDVGAAARRARRVETMGWGQLSPFVEWAERTDNLSVWSEVRDQAMRLALEDYRRGTGREFAVRPEHVAQIARLAASARACDIDAACLEVEVDDDIRGDLLEAHRGLRQQLAAARHAPTRGARRAAVHRLHLDLATKRRHHGMIANAAVRVAGGDLVVPIDPGPYHAVCGKMRDIVHRYWRTDDLRVMLSCEASVPGGAHFFGLPTPPPPAAPSSTETVVQSISARFLRLEFLRMSSGTCWACRTFTTRSSTTRAANTTPISTARISCPTTPPARSPARAGR